MNVRILSGDGTTVRATPLSIADYSTAANWNTTLRNKIFADGDAGAGSYTTLPGDILVVEVGHNDNAGATISGSSRWGSAGAGGFVGENETDTGTTLNPFFELSLDLAWFELVPIYVNPYLPKIRLPLKGPIWIPPHYPLTDATPPLNNYSIDAADRKSVV